MPNVHVSWEVPETRESGLPLPTNEIDSVVIELSADGGNNFVEIQRFPPTVTSFTQTELEPGDWHFRGYVLDTAGRASAPVSASINIPDNSAPGPLNSLNLSL